MKSWRLCDVSSEWLFTFPLSLVEKETAVPLPEDKTRLFFFTEHSKVTVVCQKDFVPYTTRIYNFISSFNNPGGDE